MHGGCGRRATGPCICHPLGWVPWGIPRGDGRGRALGLGLAPARGVQGNLPRTSGARADPAPGTDPAPGARADAAPGPGTDPASGRLTRTAACLEALLAKYRLTDVQLEAEGMPERVQLSAAAAPMGFSLGRMGLELTAEGCRPAGSGSGGGDKDEL